MLVSHKFVELLRAIKDDHSFDKTLFHSLTESERDFMQYLLKMSKIESREFESAFNQTISHWVDRLNMLKDAIKIGDDNPTLQHEMKEILDKLYEKGVFSHQFYMQFNRSLRIGSTKS
jgi:predicted transcriptional regulator YheO